jgi:hypothetical protein
MLSILPPDITPLLQTRFRQPLRHFSYAAIRFITPFGIFIIAAIAILLSLMLLPLFS